MAVERQLAEKYELIAPLLDERQRRRWLGIEARALGRGGVSAVARATGASRTTVTAAVAEVAGRGQDSAAGRVRRAGAGRPRLRESEPGVVAALERLVDPATRGDPESPLRWTSKSTRTLADELGAQGHSVAPRTVAKLLHESGYSLQATRKTREGAAHPDRDAQFRYLSGQINAHLGTGDPVVSVDTKKKELVGRYKNGGREWQPTGEPEQVEVYDFIGEAGKAIPYGVYDVAANAAWVSVGRDHDTAAFAVATLRRWWQAMGRPLYPHARRLLICADGGGSNGYRVRLWKVELAAFAAQTGLAITVCHLPPGTSKWNRIEHRLFSHISMNWRGRPLESHETVVQLIAATTTRTGLAVQAELDDRAYPKGTKISDEQMASLPLTRHDFHGEWNYTLQPE
ncbi:MAG TPA: ISAzo13 family transposase [Mycobacterium sp.]|nr:ISAzo13 family transposase [Mycobacterium sp.]